MALLPPDVRVRIYQLEENGGGTDLQKKVSPAQVEYTTGGASNGFYLISMSDVTETLEIDNGVYMIDSVSLTIDGLSATFFSSYDDPINEPFVCEIYDNNDLEVIFHGPIDRKSIKYDARSTQHTFDILSWTYVLEQTTAASRTVYETKMTKAYESTGALFAQTKLTIPGTSDDGEDMSAGNIVVGDCAVFSSTYGEYRGVITEIISANSTTIELGILGEPNATPLFDFTVTAGNCSLYAEPSWDRLKAVVLDATFRGVCEELETAFLEDGPEFSRSNQFFNASITFSTGSGQKPVQFNWAPGISDEQGARVVFYNGFELDPDGVSVNLYIDATSAEIADAIANGIVINSTTVPTEVKKGSKVRILGKNVYGYAPGGTFGVGESYETDEILEGMFSLADLGVFQYVSDTFTYPTAFVDRRMARWLEWPPNLIKALRLYQNTEQCFLKLTPTLDGSDLPRMTVELIDRRDVNTATLGAATTVTGIIDYTEDAADLTPRGAYCKPFMKYKQPHGFKIYDTEGFYSPLHAPTLSEGGSIDPKTTNPPDASDVVEFKINMTPDWINGDVWVSSGKGVWNPKNLKQWAKFYYDFYDNLPKKCSFSFDGKIARSLLGEFVAINEGGLSRTIFVTKRSYNPISRDTRIDGYVGEFTPADADNPVAIVEGENLYLDTGATGLNDIWASGMQSYSPLGLPLTYEWFQDPDGLNTSVSTNPVLELTSLATGAYTWDLVVTDSNANTDTARHIVFIGDDADAGSGAYTEEAQIVSGPTLSRKTNGDVYILLSGAKALTQDTASIDIETSLISATGAWSAVAGSPFNNPITTEQLIYSGLAEDAQLWVKIELLNREDGSTSTNSYVVSTSNPIGGEVDNQTVGVLLDVAGDIAMDSLTGASASFKVATQEYLLIDDVIGVQIDLAATDVFTVDNSTAECLEISDTGTKFTQLTGDSFAVYNNLTSTNYLNIDDTGFFVGNLTLLDEFRVTHNGMNKFNIFANGMYHDIDSGDIYKWDINGVEMARMDNSQFQLTIDLDMNTNDIVSVGSITGSGTISGFTVNAGGANFGPGAVTSITVVNGIVTAIS